MVPACHGCSASSSQLLLQFGFLQFVSRVHVLVHVLALCRHVEEAFDNGYLSIIWEGLRGAPRSEGLYRMHWLGDAELRVQDMPHYPWKASAGRLSTEVQKALLG